MKKKIYILEDKGITIFGFFKLCNRFAIKNEAFMFYQDGGTFSQSYTEVQRLHLLRYNKEEYTDIIEIDIDKDDEYHIMTVFKINYPEYFV